MSSEPVVQIIPPVQPASSLPEPRAKASLFLSRHELQEMGERARALIADPELLATDVRETVILSYLVLKEVLIKAKGRRASQDISVAVDRLAKIVQSMYDSGFFASLEKETQWQEDGEQSGQQSPRELAPGYRPTDSGS